MRGILCFLAVRQLQKLRLVEGARREMPGGHFRAERPTLIEIVDNVTGADLAPVKVPMFVIHFIGQAPPPRYMPLGGYSSNAPPSSGKRLAPRLAVA